MCQKLCRVCITECVLLLKLRYTKDTNVSWNGGNQYEKKTIEKNNGSCHGSHSAECCCACRSERRCGAAQRNFNYYYTDDNQCADYGINYSRDKIGTANSFAAPDDLDDLSYYGSSIVLGSGIVQRHYFRLNTGDISNYTFIVDKKPAVPTQSKSDESLYYVDATKNGAAMKLYDASEIKAYKTSEPSKTITFNYSVMDYVGIAKNKGISGKAFEVIKTLSWLADEAKAYFEIN